METNPNLIECYCDFFQKKEEELYSEAIDECSRFRNERNWISLSRSVNYECWVVALSGEGSIRWFLKLSLFVFFRQVINIDWSILHQQPSKLSLSIQLIELESAWRLMICLSRCGDLLELNFVIINCMYYIVFQTKITLHHLIVFGW